MKFMFLRDNSVVCVMVKKKKLQQEKYQPVNKEKVVLFSFCKLNIIIMKVNTVSGRNNF